MAKHRGNPVFTVRMPREKITGLQILANQSGKTTSEIVRNLVEKELEEQGIRTTVEPLPGQIRFE